MPEMAVNHAEREIVDVVLHDHQISPATGVVASVFDSAVPNSVHGRAWVANTVITKMIPTTGNIASEGIASQWQPRVDWIVNVSPNPESRLPGAPMVLQD